MIYTLIVFLSLVACSSEKDDPVLSPSNLEIAVEQPATTSGKVTVTATADNANYYDFDFGVDASTAPLTDDDGVVEYTYSQSGTYTITARAYATSDVFIEATKNVDIAIEEVPVDDTGYTTPTSYDGYTLVWQDEFEGTVLNTSDWTYEIGTGSNGWGNNELQYYREENTKLADGYLTIEARNESFEGQSYTSSRLKTAGKREFKYGRIDIRAKLPQGQGIWPALWMLGQNISTVGWPKCGEIDIMEMIGGSGNENTVHGTLHWDNNGSHACTCEQNNNYQLSNGIFADQFHVFTIIWDANNIKWYVDDNLFTTVDITPADLSEFQQEFFLIFNVAVGGNCRVALMHLQYSHKGWLSIM